MLLKTKSGASSFNFLQEATEQQKFRYGLFMWGAFYFGYFIFCLNWLIFSNLEGSVSGSGTGWANIFSSIGLGTDASTISLRTDAVNYGLTFARGLSTISVAWLMTKLSHKRAALLAFFLNTISLPLLWAPRYELLVLGRMLMAAGGTMFMILIQPVISRFFNLKNKGILSSITPTAYIMAGLTANLLFVYSGSSEWLKTWFLTNWRAVTAVCAGMSYIPFLAYMKFGRNFTTADNLQDAVAQEERPENTYSGIIKEKKCWFWIFFYSFLLVASLLVSIKVPKLIGSIAPSFNNTLSSQNVSWEKLYICFFYAGCLLGMFWGRWSKTKYQRKPIIALCCAMGLISWLFIFGAAHIPDNRWAMLLVMYSVFIFAFFAMGIQSVILYVPHEYPENNNAKRLTIFYAYLWGIGYIIFTVYQIIVSSFMVKDSSGTISSVWAYSALGLITLFVALFAIFAFTIKEPRPEYKFFPGLNQFSDIWKKRRIFSKHWI